MEHNRKRLLFFAVIVLYLFVTLIIAIRVSSQIKEVQNSILNLSTLKKDVEKSGADKLIAKKEPSSNNEMALNDFDDVWKLAKEYASSDFEKANYFYLNALHKNPGNVEIWEDYVKNAIGQCDADGLSLLYSNLDVAIISVDSRLIEKMIALKKEVLDKMLSLDSEPSSKPVSSTDINDFHASCEKFLALFADSKNSVDKINTQFSELSDTYLNIGTTADIDLVFENASTIMNLLNSIIELHSYGEYASRKFDQFSDLLNSIKHFNTTKKSLEYTYDGLGKTYGLIDSKIRELDEIEAAIKGKASSALKEVINNKRPSLTTNNAKKVDALNAYQLYLQELLQLLGDQVDFYDFINAEMMWINTSIKEISVDRQKKYQRWAYNELEKVKDLAPKNSTKADYKGFISIDVSLLIPELYVIYSNILKNISKNLKDFDSLVHESIGHHKSLEDF